MKQNEELQKVVQDATEWKSLLNAKRSFGINNFLLLNTLIILIIVVMSSCENTQSKTGNDMAPTDSMPSGSRQLSKMSAEQKKQEQQYFGEHSFGFSSIFKTHHPGPHWILENAEQFQLTEDQKKQQKELNLGMAKETISANTTLKKAYERYASDAAMAEPSLVILKSDIEEIGKAQTHLALVMIPYHLKSYALLKDSQKSLYNKLAEQQ